MKMKDNEQATEPDANCQPNQEPPTLGKSGCTMVGPGRGDCEHFVGLPGISNPGQHDGPDDTVDEYGKPYGWCWSCWKSHIIAQLRTENKKFVTIVENEPLLYSTEEEHRKLEAFADRCVTKMRMIKQGKPK